MGSFTLDKKSAGLLIIDVQEKLFRLVDHSCQVMQSLQKVVKGCRVLGVPIVVTEQYPQGLGSTVETLKSFFGDSQKYLTKTSFSCLGQSDVKKEILAMPVQEWIVGGIEAHVCVLQTVKDLISQGKRVVVLNDAITSRSIYDFSTAIAEMRDAGARISSTETVLFEMLKDSKSPEFKAMSELIK